MNKRLTIILYLVLTLSLVVQPFLPLLSQFVVTRAKASYQNEFSNMAEEDYDDDWSDVDFSKIPIQEGTPSALIALDRAASPEKYNQQNNSNIFSNTASTPTAQTDRAFSGLLGGSSQKIIFNPQDASDVRKLYCISSLFPDYDNDIVSVATDSGKNITDVAQMKTNDSKAFTALTASLKTQRQSQLLATLKLPQYGNQLQCILDTQSVQQAYETANSDGGDAQITMAIDQAQKIDTRVLKMLVYLVTPKNQGGAGHDRINVYRLKRNYTMPLAQFDRESEAIIAAKIAADRNYKITDPLLSENQTIGQASTDTALATGQVTDGSKGTVSTGDFTMDYSDLDRAISAHADGEAVDISEVDNIKCTLIKRKRVGSDNKTAQPPVPIKLVWQTNEGYDATSGQRDSVNSLVNGLYKDGILQLLNQFGVDLNNIDNMSADNFSDILNVVGQSIIGQLLNTGGAISSSDLEDIMQHVGAIYLADKLQLPRAALYGSGYKNLDDLKVNLGRATVEERMNLPVGSLSGSSSKDILYTVGERKVEKELELPAGTLSPDLGSEKQVMIKVGASILENKLNFPSGSFLKPNLPDLRQAAGSTRFDLVFAQPAAVDTSLSLEDGLSQQFKSKQITPDTYLTKIAFAQLSAHGYIFTNYQSDITHSSLPNPPNSTNSSRDAAFGTPTGTFDRALTGNPDSMVVIGESEIAKRLSSRSDEQAALVDWLNNQTFVPTGVAPVGLITTTYQGKPYIFDSSTILAGTNLSVADFYYIFASSSGGAGAIFSKIGATRLYEAIKDSPDVAKAKQQFLDNNPSLASAIDQVAFYKNHLTSISLHLDNLDKDWETIKNDPQYADVYAQYKGTRDQIKNNKSNASAYAVELAKNAQSSFAIIRTRLEKDDKFKQTTTAMLRELDQIYLDIESILSGQDVINLNDIKFADLADKTSSSNGSTTAGYSLQKILFQVLAGKIKLTDALLMIGGNRLEDQLNLPAYTFSYFVQGLRQSGSVIPGATQVTTKVDYNGLFSFDPSLSLVFSQKQIAVSPEAQSTKDRFFVSIGQAAVEEAANLDINSFQGQVLPDARKTETLSDVIGHLASGGRTATDAKAMLARGFGITGSLDRLMSGDQTTFAANKTLLASFDQKLNLSPGTTAQFITGQTVGRNSSYYLSTQELQQVSAALGISVSALTRLTKVLSGQENYKVDPFDFSDFNPYATTSTVNGDGSCQAVDGMYKYTDQDGTHTFVTREQATNYFNAHKDRQLDYIGEISGRMANILQGNKSWDVAALTNYLKNPQSAPRAFSDDSINAISQQTGVGAEILDRLFVSETKKSNLFNYLITVGQKVGTQRLTGILMGSLGISIGGYQLTAGDLFDVLNGQGQSILTNLADAVVTDQLGLQKGTLAKVINASNADVRKCLLEQAGAAYLFKAFGINGVNFYGDPMAAIGGAKIENALGWPTNTFKSSQKGTAGLSDLLNIVGPNLFVKGFALPIAGLDFHSAIRSLLPNTKDADYNKLDNYQLLNFLDQRAHMADIGDAVFVTANEAVKAMIIKRLSYIQDANSIIWTYNPTGTSQNLSPDTSGSMIIPAYDPFSSITAADLTIVNNSTLTLPDFVTSESNPILGSIVQSAGLAKEIAAFRSRLTNLDLRVAAADGSTKSLLLGQVSPDDYRNNIAKKQVAILAAMKLAELLGMDPEDVVDIQNIFTVLSSSGKLTNLQKATFYHAFTHLVGLNLDKAFSFDKGTIESVILSPDKARYILINQGLKRLDAQLFPEGSAFSTAKIYAAKVNGFAQTNCDVKNGKLQNCRLTELTGSAAMRAAASGEIAQAIVQRSKNTLMIPPQAQIQFLSQFFYTGDMNVLKALASSEMVARINNIIDVQGHASGLLPKGFQVTWDDLYGSVVGNSDLEDYAAKRARLLELQTLTSPSFNTMIATTTADDYAKSGGYGVTGQVGIEDQANPYSGPSREQPSASIYDMTKRSIDNSLPVTAGSGTIDSQIQALQTQLLTGPDPTKFVADDPQYRLQVASYQANLNLVNQKETQARDLVRQAYRKNLEYHYLDSLLFQKDANIPPGFSAALFEGNAHTRTMALLAWVKNGIYSGEFLGDKISPEIRPILMFLADRAYTGSTAKAFDDFVTSGQINVLDQNLINKFDSTLGVSFAKGTFTALLVGWKNGNNFVDDMKIGTTTVKSLKTIYVDNFTGRIGGWLDNQLGLPSGTAYNVYQMYTGLKEAQNALSLASAQFTAANGQMWANYRAGITVPPGTPGINDDFNTMFGNEFKTPGEVASFPSKADPTKTVDIAAKDKANATAAEAKLKDAQTKVAMAKSMIVTFVVTTVFADQLAALDQSLGLVPGTMSMIVGQAIGMYYGVAMNPVLFAALVIAMNLFGVYRIDLVCTADGYYPEMQSPPSDAVYDNGHLGTFDGLNASARKINYVKAAQYKARRLLGDVLDLPAKFNNQQMTPSQIMTGRREDVDYWFPTTARVIYQYTGYPDPTTGLLSTRAGLWQNPQTTMYTHIGF